MADGDDSVALGQRVVRQLQETKILGAGDGLPASSSIGGEASVATTRWPASTR
jgi:hypothetical protein